jgi:hypothetical protein
MGSSVPLPFLTVTTIAGVANVLDCLIRAPARPYGYPGG